MKIADIAQVHEGDICPKCGGKLKFEHGIEVGNLFKLGTKYAQTMGLQYLDKDNQLQPSSWAVMASAWSAAWPRSWSSTMMSMASSGR